MATDVSYFEVEGDSTIYQFNDPDAETALTALNQRLQTAEGNITTLQGDVTTLDENVTGVQSDVATLQGDVSTAQGNISTLQGDVATAQDEISTLQGDVSRVEAAVWKRVWTNPNPSAAFPAQTINLNLSGYSYVKIYTNYSGNSATQIVGECAIGKRVALYALANIIGNSYVGARTRTISAASTGVTVDLDYYHMLNQNTYSDGTGTYLIPAEIWAR